MSAANGGLLEELPPPAPGTQVRLVATNDVLGRIVPVPATHGAGGSIPGVIELLADQREWLEALWVDCGDFTVGGEHGLFGHRVFEDLPALPLAASVAGNHEFDDGGDALERLAQTIGFPLLCADRDVGLPGSVLIDTPKGAVGLVGITHPFAHELSLAPPPAGSLPGRVIEHAERLRSDGARWVIALLHDGVTWWTDSGRPWALGTRATALQDLTRGWAAQVDAILTGHTLGAWTGALHGTPCGQGHPFAASVLAVDLGPGAPRATIHPPTRVPPATIEARGTAAAIATAASHRVANSTVTWESRPGAEHYLPNLVAAAIRRAAGADAGFVPADQLFTQAPLDGIVAALRQGAVTELDLICLFPFPDDAVAVVELQAGEFSALVRQHDADTRAGNATTDSLWWNWARAPAGTSVGAGEPRSLAIAAFAVPLLESWLGRAVSAHPTTTGGRRGLEMELTR